jgi:hypothetical protein
MFKKFTIIQLVEKILKIYEVLLHDKQKVLVKIRLAFRITVFDVKFKSIIPQLCRSTTRKCTFFISKVII